MENSGVTVSLCFSLLSPFFLLILLFLLLCLPPRPGAPPTPQSTVCSIFLDADDRCDPFFAVVLLFFVLFCFLFGFVCVCVCVCACVCVCVCVCVRRCVSLFILFIFFLQLFPSLEGNLPVVGLDHRLPGEANNGNDITKLQFTTIYKL